MTTQIRKTKENTWIVYEDSDGFEYEECDTVAEALEIQAEYEELDELFEEADKEVEDEE